jgi:hypothetical protein
MTDKADQPPAQWRRQVADDEADASIPEPSSTNAVAVGMAFVSTLATDPLDLDGLAFLVTPESLPSWGDFSGPAAWLATIGDWGVGSVANEAIGAPDVAYVKIVRGVDQSCQVVDEQIIAVPGVVTLVWRPERGMWLVHAIGEFVRPEDVPRTA